MQLPPVATLPQASALLHRLDAALAAAGGGELVIDASELYDFDTSTVAVLLHAQRLANAGGIRLRIAGAPAKLRELALLYGVDELLPLDPAPSPAAASPSPSGTASPAG